MTANAYLDSMDIANRACIHNGVSLIKSVDEDSQRNNTITFVYDKLRQDELRRNTWVFAKRKVVLRAIDPTTRVLNPNDWDASILYTPGAIVKHRNGGLWYSVYPDNLNNEPGVTDAWDSYFGALTVQPWDSTQGYFPGELVYVPQGNPGQFIVYMSKTMNNLDTPTTAAAWSATATYQIDDVVTHSGSTWRSVIAVNKNVTPATAPDNWNSTVGYVINDTVVASDGYIYTASGSTTGNDPVTDAGAHWVNGGIPYAWNATPPQEASAASWFPIYAGLKNVDPSYLGLLMGAGPLGNAFAVNAFMLPSGFLREVRLFRQFAAPNTDRERLGNFVTSNEPILLFPFCADITNVRTMDPMFCEGLAARIGFEVSETLTQSAGKKQAIVSVYKQFMTEARTINAIEIGPEEPDEDTFISVRRMGFPWQNG